MNITSQNYAPPIQTAVNLQTDSLRRENQQREVIAKPEAASHSAAEKGVASDKERGRTPAQNNEQVDFESLREQAELAGDSIGDDESNHHHSSQDDSSHANNDDSVDTSSKTNGDPDSSNKSDRELFVEEQEIKALKRRDQEVRAHELAHAAVGGAHTGAPNYSFELGPDGKKYAVGGEVSVDVSPIKGDPRATIAKMQKVHAAALAPANPSVQDTRVAASAAKIIAQAQAELAKIDVETPSINKTSGVSKPIEVLSEDSEGSQKSEQDFDQLISKTLSDQEEIAPSRPSAIDERASRIEAFYITINHAYEKPPSHQFELTA